MHVYVNVACRQIEVDDAEWIAPGVEHRAERLRNCARELEIAHRPAVDQHVEMACTRTRPLRRSQVRFDREWAAREAHRRQRLTLREGQRALVPGRGAQILTGDLAVTCEHEGDVGARQRRAAHDVVYVRGLGRHRFEELAPSGHVVK